MIGVVFLLLAGCAGRGGIDASMRVYDLGIESPAARFPGLQGLRVRAAAPFDTNDMLYRLAFRNPAELHAFSQSRWAATPAVLLQRRFSRAAADGPARCAMEFEVSEFTQVFASRDASDIVLEGRAALLSGTRRVAERVFRVVETDAGGSAASGARGVARAADRLIGEIAAWSSGVAACGPD
ncbi:MAG: hypothetical protein AB7O31_16095 [Burkholderiales bacterium]